MSNIEKEIWYPIGNNPRRVTEHTATLAMSRIKTFANPVNENYSGMYLTTTPAAAARIMLDGKIDVYVDGWRWQRFSEAAAVTFHGTDELIPIK